MVNVRTAIGTVLYETRRDKKLTLRQVATRASVSLGYLSEVERGHKEVSSEILKCIADGLQIPLSEILISAGYHLQIWAENPSLQIPDRQMVLN